MSTQKKPEHYDSGFFMPDYYLNFLSYSNALPLNF